MTSTTGPALPRYCSGVVRSGTSRWTFHPPGWSIALLAWAASAAFTLWLYGDSPRYGLMLDDAMDLPRASGRGYLDLLTSAGDSSYYRPLLFLVWKALYDLLGRHDPAVLHGVGLLLHSFNGALVYALASRLAGRLAGAAAALFFLSFPFSYQDVPLINSTFHLLLALLVLGALSAYWLARRQRSVVGLGASLIIAMAAMFTHELGVILAPVVLAGEMREAALGRPARWSWAAAYGVAVVVFAGVWWTVPRWPAGWHADPANLLVNSAYFAQGMLFPLARALPSMAACFSFTGLGNEGIIAVAALTGLGAAGLLARRCGRLTLLAVLLIAYGAAVFPAWLILSYHAYVVDAPRLMYLASIPAALVWGILVVAPAGRSGGWRWTGTSLTVVLAAVILWQNVGFVGRQTALMALSGQVQAGLARAVQELPEDAGDGLLVVNFPFWLAPKDEQLLLGHTGHASLPDYIGLERLAYVLTGRQVPVTSVSFPSLAAPVGYTYGYHGKVQSLEELGRAARQARAVYLAEYRENSLRLRKVGGRGPAGPERSYGAEFGGWVRLEETRYERDGDRLEVALRWRAIQSPGGDYTAFIHLYGSDGRPVAQADGYPLAGLLPPRLWQPGEALDDRRTIGLPPGLSAGEYTLALGWYDRATGQRAEARDASGGRYRDDVVIVERIALE